MHLPFGVDAEFQRFGRGEVVAKDSSFQPWPTFDVPVAAVRLKDQTRSPIFALDDPSAGKRLRPHDDDALVNARVPLGEGEWSGAPRARCVDRSPMTLATAQLSIPKPLLTPESRTSNVETAHLAKRHTFWPRKAEAHGGITHHFAHRLRWEIEPASRWMWSYPALHLVEILLDIVRRERLTVLKAHPCAQVKFERMVVQPACISGEGIDDTPVLGHTDRFLHRVPGDKQPVQRRGIEDIDNPNRRTPLCIGMGDHRLTLLSRSTNSRRCVRDR